ncbi:unnamed protein product [Colias eurytheme]|nr:unnamed protein product [Colias eurytheme]
MNMVTTATRKADIKIWMEEHGVSFEEDSTKAELLVQLKQYLPEKKHLVDELLRANGHPEVRKKKPKRWLICILWLK